MDDTIRRLKELTDASDNIVFFFVRRARSRSEAAAPAAGREAIFRVS